MTSCGAIAFRKCMDDLGCTADIVLGAAGTLLYSTRIEKNGEVHIFGINFHCLLGPKVQMVYLLKVAQHGVDIIACGETTSLGWDFFHFTSELWVSAEFKYNQ